MITMKLSITYLRGKVFTHVSICRPGINLKKLDFLQWKHSIVPFNMANISKGDYEHAQMVWKELGIRNLGEYHDLYLCTDVILLVNVFEAFRDICLENYKLDPANFYTSPDLAWKSCSRRTGIKLELLTDPDMLLMFEHRIRGGITQAVHRYAMANNPYIPYMGDRYNPNADTTYLQYLDADNLYGWVISQPLPTGRLRWVDVRPDEIG